MTLRLDRSVHTAICEHAEDGAPEEVCGVLGGGRGTDGETSLARRAEGVTNVAEAPRIRYELDATEQFRAMEAIEDAGEDVVGFYHSHPRGPSRPSATDEALATWTGHSYVIVSLAGPEPEVRSWRWTGERFEHEAVEVVEEG
jgi:proteasome lid subunit RPN8/RPN11